MAIRVSFLGGAEKVTSSQFLVESGSSKLLVDCGIEQGKDFCEACEYEDFLFEPSTLSALVVTHAHLDHVGRIPKLVHDGFRGPIFTTPPTRDLMELILRDSAEILRQEAERHHLRPLYSEQDVT